MTKKEEINELIRLVRLERRKILDKNDDLKFNNYTGRWNI